MWRGLGQQYKLHWERFHLDIRIISHWYNLPEGTAASSSLDGQAMGHLSQAPCPHSRAGCPSNMGCSEPDYDSLIILKACLERG